MFPFPPSEIAAKEARRLALVLQEVGGDGAPIGEGWMACDQPGSWADYASGLGVSKPVDEATLDALVDFYRQRGRPAKIKVTPYQHSTLLRGLADRSFGPYQLDTILVRPLDKTEPFPPYEKLKFHRIDPSNHTDVIAFRNSQMTGFFDDQEAPAGMLPITERVTQVDRCLLWLIERNGNIVGSGGLEFFKDGAVLIAGCVHKQARGKGLHSAFISHRLAHAAKAGLRYATIGSEPGGPTERNALRAGFQVAYTEIGLQQR